MTSTLILFLIKMFFFRLTLELRLGYTGAQNNYDTLTNCNKVENDKI